ncbi:MAG: bifunctional 4-hydroxy-2-oxoglutarate aldolase/2-dehydro-3-deoxy-phosphogluconate aldolase [Chloroflexi bacterium]|nr:bifunctional 4-hydroxy-2-oxoglutarate aldolase/2-dehydro-3-deoxy-phosphogluconate aldolase [Chloroflexota bacterium]
MHDILHQLGRFGLIPVVAIDDANDAARLGEALLAGGLPCAEITFRTAAAAEAMHAISTAYPEMLLGAGTVLTIEQAQRAVEAGARFIVAPGFDVRVVDWCLEHEVPVTPGVVTPTEISAALAKGLHVLKFFPAEAMGGIPTLKAVSGPFGGVKFIPTGGINAANLADYLRLPVVHACGGSWIVKKQLIADGAFDTITQLVQAALAIVRAARGQES